MQGYPPILIFIIIAFMVLLIAFLSNSYYQLKRREDTKIKILMKTILEEKNATLLLEHENSSLKVVMQSIKLKLKIVNVNLLNIQFSLLEILH